MGAGSTIKRTIARVWAYLRGSWEEEPGKEFRRCLEEASDATHPDSHRYQYREKKGWLGRLAGRWIGAEVSGKQNAALSEAADVVNKKLDARLKERTMEADVQKSEAEALSATAKAHIDVVAATRAKVELIEYCQEYGLVIDVDGLNQGSIAIHRHPALIELPESDEDDIIDVKQLEPTARAHDCAPQSCLSDLASHRQFIESLPERSKYSKDELLVDELRIFKNDELEIYYAPFGWINESARIAIVGITPGFTQMEIAVRVARQALLEGAPPEAALQVVKAQARFAGSMRTNLITMLDDLGVAEHLGIEGCSGLFTEHLHLLHSTSTLRYPVFKSKKNYTGHGPKIRGVPELMSYVTDELQPELEAVPGALIVPLGKAVEEVLAGLAADGRLCPDRVLFGFPHPSGANGHRQRQFDGLRGELTGKAREWFGGN
jgi:hypothetical protein